MFMPSQLGVDRADARNFSAKFLHEPEYRKIIQDLGANCATAFQSTLHGNRVAHYANRIIEEAHGDFSALDIALKTIVLRSRLEKGL